MDIFCPNCTSHYQINPRSLGKAGRNVQCMQCTHIWRVMPPEIVTEPELPTAIAGDTHTPFPSPTEKMEARIARVEAEERTPARGRWRRVMEWLITLLLLTMLLALIVVGFRYELAERWPMIDKLLTKQGLVVPQDMHIASYSMTRFRDVLQVRSKIIGTKSQESMVRLRVTLLDHTGEMLDQHYHFLHPPTPMHQVETVFSAPSGAVDHIDIQLQDTVQYYMTHWRNKVTNSISR